MSGETFHSTNGEFRIDEDGLLLAVTKGVGRSTEAMMSEALGVVDQLRGNAKLKALWDARKAEMSPQSWMTLASGLTDRFLAIGVIATESQQESWSSYRDRFNSLLIPFGVFDNEADARAWLDQIGGNF